MRKLKTLKSKFGEDAFNIHISFSDVDTKAMLKKLSLTECPLYGLDIETEKKSQFIDHKKAGLCPHLSKIRLVQIYNGSSVYVFDLRKTSLLLLVPFLKANKFIAHNAKFELSHFTHAGIPNLNVGCSMLAAMLVDRAENSPFEPEPEEQEELDENPDGMAKYKRTSMALDAVVSRLFKVRVSKDQQTSNWNEETLTTIQLAYAGLDAVLTYKVGVTLAPKLAKYKMLRAYQLLKDMQHVIVEMELTGFTVDWTAHALLVKKWTKKGKECEAACKPFFGETNLNSSLQMGKWLQNYYGHHSDVVKHWPKTKKGAFSFTRFAIGDYVSYPPIKALLEFKKYNKLLTTYGQALLDRKHPLTGKIHCDFSLGETRTGRLSSRNPNLQNQPRDGELRSIFIASPNKSFVVADYSQIEMRIAGAQSNDPVINKAYFDGHDLHKVIVHTATKKPLDQISDQERQLGKAINFGFLYGMGPRKFSKYAFQSYGVVTSEADAIKIHRAFHKLYSHYSEWCDNQREKCRNTGFVRTPMGKMRKLMEEELYTRAVNTVIQGGAAEVMMLAMILLQRKIQSGRLPFMIVNSIHDEIIIEVPIDGEKQAELILEECMKDAMYTIFPNAPLNGIAESSHGHTWTEAKKKPKVVEAA